MTKERLVELYMKPLEVAERVHNKLKFDQYKGENYGLPVDEGDRRMRKMLGIAQSAVGLPVIGGAVFLVVIYASQYA